MLISNAQSPAVAALVALLATSCAPASASKPAPISVSPADAISSTENAVARADAGELEMDAGNIVAPLDASDDASFVLTEEEQAYVDGTVPIWELGLPSRTYAMVDQRPPKGYRVIRENSSRPYPGVRFVTVRGFAYNHMGFADAALLERDGTLGPSVIWPGATLNQEQTKRLIALARQDSYPKMRVGCFDPHHAFIFYDAHERPVATLNVCFECISLQAQPNTPDFENILTGEKYKAFHKLCRELNLPGCDDVDRPNEGRKEVVDRALDEASARIQSELRVSAMKNADSPVLRERMSLCDYVVWSARKEWRGSSPTLQCNDGRILSPPIAGRCAQWIRDRQIDGAEATACFDAWNSDLCFTKPSTREACSAFPEGVAGVRWWPAEQRDEAKRWINGQSK